MIDLDKGACIVNYCTNDYRFLSLCLNELKKLFKVIIIPVCDHFFDGQKESRELLDRSYCEHPDVHFIEFAYGHQLYGLNQFRDDKKKVAHFWHSTARYVGWHYLPSDIEWTLFLDIDEILDVDRFKTWASQSKLYDAIRFDSYFYYQLPTQRAKTFTQNGLIVRNAKTHPDDLLVTGERMDTYRRINGDKIEHVRGLDDAPLFHHYSWVRTHDELVRKVQSWGHRSEKKWEALLKQEFSTVDPLFGLEYETCEAAHNPMQMPLSSQEGIPNITKTNREALLAYHFERFY